MKINLNRKPSLDGLGVKRWTFKVDDFLTLVVFDRPYNVRGKGRTYLLRLDHADGRIMDFRFADFKSQAEDKGEWMIDRALRGELEDG